MTRLKLCSDCFVPLLLTGALAAGLLTETGQVVAQAPGSQTPDQPASASRSAPAAADEQNPASSASTEETPPQPAAAAEESSAAALPDPTVPGPDLRTFLKNQPGTTAAPHKPDVQLKGRVIRASGEGLAVISVDGQFVRLRPGRETSVSTAAGVLTIRLEELSDTVVRVKLDPLEQQLDLQ